MLKFLPQVTCFCPFLSVCLLIFGSAWYWNIGLIVSVFFWTYAKMMGWISWITTARISKLVLKYVLIFNRFVSDLWGDLPLTIIICYTHKQSVLPSFRLPIRSNIVKIIFILFSIIEDFYILFFCKFFENCIIVKYAFLEF